jgi:hypothetical protein
VFQTIKSKFLVRYFLSSYAIVFTLFFLSIFLINIKDLDQADSLVYSILKISSSSLKDLIKISDFIVLLTTIVFINYIKERFNFYIFIENGMRFIDVFRILFVVIVFVFILNICLYEILSILIDKQNIFHEKYSKISFLKNGDIYSFYVKYNANKTIIEIKDFFFVSKLNEIKAVDYLLIDDTFNDKIKILNSLSKNDILYIINTNLNKKVEFSFIAKILISFSKFNYESYFMQGIYYDVIQFFLIFFSFFISMLIALNYSVKYNRFKNNIVQFTKNILTLILIRNAIFIIVNKFEKFFFYERLAVAASISLIFIILLFLNINKQENNITFYA